jgi:hypothetical protein
MCVRTLAEAFERTVTPYRGDPAAPLRFRVSGPYVVRGIGRVVLSSSRECLGRGRK